MGLFDRDIYESRTTTTAPRTSTRVARRQPTYTPRTSSRVPRRQPTFNPIPPQGGGGYTGGTGGGGGGGGFGGGSGGGAGDGRGNSSNALANNRGQRLKAALEAIKADFALRRGGLGQQLEELKALFDRGLLQNQRDTRDTTENVNESAAERGLFRSGIRQKNLARQLAPLAEQRSDLIGLLNTEEGAEGTQVRELMSLIKLLIPEEARAGANAELESEREELEFNNFLATTAAGL